MVTDNAVKFYAKIIIITIKNVLQNVNFIETLIFSIKSSFRLFTSNKNY